MTVKEYFAIYSEDQMARMAYGTWYPRLNLIQNHFLPKFGEKELNEVLPSDINCTYDAMESSGLKQNTLFGMYAAFRSFFGAACHDGYVDHNVAENARKISQDYTI